MKQAEKNMSWFKRDSPLRSSFRRQSFSPPPKLDEGACLEVFKMHWQQAWNVMERNGQGLQSVLPNVDDIRSVVNHLDQMMTLLLQEAQNQQVHSRKPNEAFDQEITGPILSYMLMEGCLDKLLSWSICSGEYVNTMKLEQLKLYEVLVTNCHQDLLFHKPVVRPLLRLLSLCGECSPVEVEKRLIILLNTLCVCLTQFPDLLQVFFGASSDHGSTRSENPRDMFLIFSLLIPFVHREGAIGQQARDALLLCMALSRRNENIGIYIAEHSNFCPVLATGLSGLYSLLPRKLPVVSEDWHHFTPEDISEMPELAMFLNSLEFCNAVIQVAHPMVQEQLLEYLYQGFLVPVLGPALHQNTVEEIIATTAYLELFLRTITEPILLQVFLKFILTATYDGHCMLNTLVDRLGAQSRLCLVTMALFRKLLDLNCEDVLFELVFRYLIPCSHVMVSQRSRVRDVDLYSRSADKFLSLIPACCIPDVPSDPSTPNKMPAPSGPYPVGLRELHNTLSGDKAQSGSLRIKRHHRSPSTSSFAFGDFDKVHSRLFASSSHSISHPTDLELYQTSYMDYLQDAHNNVRTCTLACKNWTASYDGLNPPPDSSKNLIANKELQFCPNSNSVISNSIYVSSYNGKARNSIDDCHGRKDVPLSRIQENCSEYYTNQPELSILHTHICKDLGERTSLISEKQFRDTFSNGPVLDDSSRVHSHQKSSTFSDEETIESHQENKDIFNQLASTEDEQAFWYMISSTKTPSSVSDLEDSLEIIDSCFSVTDGSTELTVRNKDSHIAFFNEAYECSNVDSGVFESRESNSSLDRDNDHVPTNSDSAKSKLYIDNLFLAGPPRPTRCDVKPFPASNSDSSSKSSSSPVSPGSWEAFGSPDIGPFLSILLTRLEMMMQNDVYTNLQLTGLLSRLAWYPQPLLRSFLLNHSLVFQPTVRSLLQVLGSLKHKVDSYSYTVDRYEDLLVKSRQFLLAREERLLGNGPPRVYSESYSKSRRGSTPEIQRGEPRRRSLTSILFRRGSTLKDKSPSKEPALESIPDGQGYRYISKPTPDALEGEMESVKTKNAVLCAVILEEFLKELAAVAQEHSIIQLDPDFWDVRWQLWD